MPRASFGLRAGILAPRDDIIRGPLPRVIGSRILQSGVHVGACSSPGLPRAGVGLASLRTLHRRVLC